MQELLKILDGKKTYTACIFSVVIAGVGYYLKVITFVELVGVVMAAITFILNRSGNKADVQKVLTATTEQTGVIKEQVDKAIAIVPCRTPESLKTQVKLEAVTESVAMLNAAVDKIINSQKNQS